MEAVQTKIPRQRPGLHLERHGHEAIVVDDGGERVCALNDTASALWELCDGETTPDEMIEAVCQACNVVRDVAQEDIARTLKALKKAGAIEWVK